MAYLCSCGQLNDRQPQRYCRSCHARYMREYRRPKPICKCGQVNTRDHRRLHSELSVEARYKANARSYANVYQRRGLLVPRPCEVCGAAAQKHHDDYSAPLQVRWLCLIHHLALHKKPKQTKVVTSALRVVPENLWHVKRKVVNRKAQRREWHRQHAG